jgi:GNAT superfamily N-acetyltransferase
MITFAREVAQQVLDDGLALFIRHNDEQIHDPDSPLDIDRDRYLLADNMGILRAFACRDNGVLVGYACFCLNFSLRHKTRYEATEDSLYLAPEYRGSTIGVRFLKFIEAELVRDGVDLIRQHTHPGTALDRILPKMGYTHTHNEYEKKVKD